MCPLFRKFGKNIIIFLINPKGLGVSPNQVWNVLPWAVGLMLFLLTIHKLHKMQHHSGVRMQIYSLSGVIWLQNPGFIAPPKRADQTHRNCTYSPSSSRSHKICPHKTLCPMSVSA